MHFHYVRLDLGERISLLLANWALVEFFLRAATFDFDSDLVLLEELIDVEA